MLQMVELHLFGVEVVQASSIHLSGGAICRHDSRCVPGAGQEGRNMNILPSNKPTSSQTRAHTLLLKALVSGARSWTRRSAGVSAFGHSPPLCIFEFWPGVPLDFETIALHIQSHLVAAVKPFDNQQGQN